jgi:hypothetical protein
LKFDNESVDVLVTVTDAGGAEGLNTVAWNVSGDGRLLELESMSGRGSRLMDLKCLRMSDHEKLLLGHFDQTRLTALEAGCQRGFAAQLAQI